MNGPRLLSTGRWSRVDGIIPGPEEAITEGSQPWGRQGNTPGLLEGGDPRAGY